MSSRLTLGKTLVYLVLILGAVAAIYPFLWMLLTSFKSYGEPAGKKEWPVTFTPAFFSRQASTTTLGDFKVGDFVYVEGKARPRWCPGGHADCLRPI